MNVCVCFDNAGKGLSILISWRHINDEINLKRTSWVRGVTIGDRSLKLITLLKLT